MEFYPNLSTEIVDGLLEVCLLTIVSRAMPRITARVGELRKFYLGSFFCKSLFRKIISAKCEFG